MNNRYLKIINLKRPVSKKHKPMSIKDRAAQFGAFAALAGYEELVIETGILKEKEVEEQGK